MNPQAASFEITIHENVKGYENQVVGNIGGTYITLLVPPQEKVNTITTGYVGACHYTHSMNTDRVRQKYVYTL
jgi:hypothetical protein